MIKSHWKNQTQTFRVWLSQLGDVCQVRVDGFENAQWLLGRLSSADALASAKPIIRAEDSSLCTFQIDCAQPLKRSDIEKLLRSVPEVQLVSDPK